MYSYIHRYASSQWSKYGPTRRSRMSPASQILTTLLTHTVVYKSTYHAKPRLIYFLPQYISAEFTVIHVLHHKLQYSTGKSEKSEPQRDSDGRGCKSHLGLGFFRLPSGFHQQLISFIYIILTFARLVKREKTEKRP